MNKFLTFLLGNKTEYSKEPSEAKEWLETNRNKLVDDNFDSVSALESASFKKKDGSFEFSDGSLVKFDHGQAG